MYLEWGMSINMGKYSDRLTHIQMLASAKYKKNTKKQRKTNKKLRNIKNRRYTKNGENREIYIFECDER